VTISEELLAAYNATDFHVFAGSPFVINIGKFSMQLESLHNAAGVSSSAIITAYNPYSEQRGSDFNERAQMKMCESIKQLGYKWIDGEGKDPTGNWPGERCVLVLGCQLAEIKTLGETFEQNAIVWADSKAVPTLEVLR